MKRKRRLIILFLTLFFILFTISYAQPENGKIYIVGVGPAGPDLCTLQALKVIQKADVIYAPLFIQDMFAEFLKGKDVRNPQVKSVYQVKGESYIRFKDNELLELNKRRKEWGKKLADEFKSEIIKGKSVAYLTRGDLCLYEDLRSFGENLDENDYLVIPGMSSFNAGAAILKKELSNTGRGISPTIIIHTPLFEEFGIRPNTKDLAKHQVTMVIFMAGGRIKGLVDDLKKHYSRDTPVAVCYFIGYPDKEKVIRGNLNDIVSKTAQEGPTEMVLIYVGNFLIN